MIVESTACLFFAILVRAEPHQQEREQKLCSATLNVGQFLKCEDFMLEIRLSRYTVVLVYNLVKFSDIRL